MKREYPDRPTVGVGAIVFRQNQPSDEFILVRRGRPPLQGEWSLPGGVLEVGETLHAGVAREVEEETGLLVRPVLLVEVLERILPDAAGKVQFHYVLLDYLCECMGGTILAGSDVTDARWARREDLAALKVAEFTQKVIAKAFDLRGARAGEQS